MSRYSRIARTLKILLVLVFVLAVATLVYGAEGYFSAIGDSETLRARADRLIAEKRGAADLGPGRIEQLLQVDDPGFWHHGGADFSTPGAGLTTITQSLAKRVGFDHFRPGIRKIRLIGYAMGLEQKLSKQQIIALYLDTVGMGFGKNGWITGFYRASLDIYGQPVAAIDQRKFLSLVAVTIAPRKYRLNRPDAALTERVDRIERMISRRCRPRDMRDVWLEGCALPAGIEYGP